MSRFHLTAQPPIKPPPLMEKLLQTPALALIFSDISLTITKRCDYFSYAFATLSRRTFKIIPYKSLTTGVS